MRDSVVENRRIGGQPRDREIRDVAFQRAAIEQFARDVVEPDALTQVVQRFSSLHDLTSRSIYFFLISFTIPRDLYRSTVELQAGTNCVRSQARSSSPCSAGSTGRRQVPAPANARSVRAECARSRKSARCLESRVFASRLYQHVRRSAAVIRRRDNRRETIASRGALAWISSVRFPSYSP